MFAIISAFGMVVVLIGILIFGPLVTIWALNLLFSLTIPFTFWTWLATLWLGGIISSAGRGK